MQQDSSNQSEIVMIKLCCCGPDYCSRCPLLYYFFQISNGLGSSVFKLCCKDSAKPCTSISKSDSVIPSSSTPKSVTPSESIRSPPLGDTSFGDSYFEDDWPDQPPDEPPPQSFTAEQVAKFERCVENNYDIFIDQDFVAWLRLYHPHYLPRDLAMPLTDIPLPNGDQSSGELMDDRPEPTPTVSQSSDPPLSQALASARVTLSSVAEFLTLPTPTSTKSKPPGSARVLTSAESLAMIIEKEQKKKEEEEAKDTHVQVCHQNPLSSIGHPMSTVDK